MPTRKVKKPPTHEEIAVRAYELWQLRGGSFGSPDVDWFRAEQELLSRRKQAGGEDATQTPDGMHPAAIQNLCDRIVRVANLAEESTILQVDWHKDHFISSGIKAYLMKEDCYEEYRQLVLDIIALPRWRE
jgi:Protein of unknown function (DUF2934)